jgi:hypothetical protein
MSNNKSNFKGGMSPCKVNIKGIVGINQITKSYTVSWTIEDNEGKPHELVILRTYYNLKSPYHLHQHLVHSRIWTESPEGVSPSEQVLQSNEEPKYTKKIK